MANPLPHYFQALCCQLDVMHLILIHSVSIMLFLHSLRQWYEAPLQAVPERQESEHPRNRLALSP